MTAAQGLQRTNQLMAFMAHFWAVMTHVFLCVCIFQTVKDQPSYAHDWHLPVVLLLVSAYSANYIIGLATSMRARTDFYSPERIRHRHIIWIIQYLLCLLLTILAPPFFNMFWVSFAQAFILNRFWRSLPFAILAMGSMLGFLLPQFGPTTISLWDAIGGILALIAYSATFLMISVLITQRYDRERLFKQLEDAHQQLQEAHHQLALSAERERELGVLRERERIARELHDTLGHALVLTSVRLDAIQGLMPVDPERALREMHTTQQSVREAMQQLRLTLAALHDDLVEPDTICARIQADIAMFQERGNLRVDATICVDVLAACPPTTRIALQRIVAEALTNCERHAHAHSVSVRLTRDHDQALLVIADDGVGLPLLPRDNDGEPTSPAGHWGLQGIHERATAMHGTCHLSSVPDKGTTLTVTIPLHPARIPATVAS